MYVVGRAQSLFVKFVLLAIVTDC
uniref:Uncharacterized protein n=1 Tax=Rhizophora mucronata TaxID=61149 RepID=A0A2P2Q350_RHIMU